MRHGLHHHRPHWWPENEPYPPSRHGLKDTRRHRRFFFRVGCALLAVNLAIILIVMLAVGLIAHARGLVQVPFAPRWILPVGVAAFLALGAFFIWGGRSFRLFTVPMMALFDASRRVADGDYTVRVREQGLPDVRALINAFNAMAARLQISDRQRRSLLADVTHELRTPLTVIRGNLEGMLDGIYAPDEARLKSTLEEVQILSRLVDDLRTLALAESGAIQFHKEAVDLPLFLAEAASAFQAQAQEGGVDLQVAVCALPGTVYLDPERMQQVLANLIVNALRYTPPGGVIRLGCQSLSALDGEPGVEITVADSGPGICKEDLPHVFERFYKSSDSGGMGLGLAIVKGIVEAHGGRISVQSEEGRGTKFTLSLPAGTIV